MVTKPEQRDVYIVEFDVFSDTRTGTGELQIEASSDRDFDHRMRELFGTGKSEFVVLDTIAEGVDKGWHTPGDVVRAVAFDGRDVTDLAVTIMNDL